MDTAVDNQISELSGEYFDVLMIDPQTNMRNATGGEIVNVSWGLL
jgi:hypothetical protein